MAEKGALLERGVFGPRLDLCEPWSPRVPRYLEEHGIKEIRLAAMEPTYGYVFEALADLDWLEGIVVEFDAELSPAPLQRLKNLRHLELHGQGRRGLDYGAFGQLERAFVEMKRAGAQTIFGCRNLRRLDLERDRGPSLERLCELKLLEHLTLRGGKLEHLAGIEQLSALRYLSGSSLARLQELRLGGDLPHLTLLSLTDCPALSTLATLERAARLRVLILGSIEVESLEPLRRLKHLEWLDLNATRVLDNDLSPIADLERESLWFLRFNESPGYAHGLRDFQSTRGPRSLAQENARVRDRLRQSDLPYMKWYLDAYTHMAYIAAAVERGDRATGEWLIKGKSPYYWEKYYEAAQGDPPVNELLRKLQPLEAVEGEIAW